LVIQPNLSKASGSGRQRLLNRNNRFLLATSLKLQPDPSPPLISLQLELNESSWLEDGRVSPVEPARLDRLPSVSVRIHLQKWTVGFVGGQVIDTGTRSEKPQEESQQNVASVVALELSDELLEHSLAG